MRKFNEWYEGLESHRKHAVGELMIGLSLPISVGIVWILHIIGLIP